MAEITAALVKELREKTGAGMMDCKKALAETSGDIGSAVDWLRTKGLAAAAKKAGRVAAEGLVGVVADGNRGAVVEVNSETDFVARNEHVPGVVAGDRQAGARQGGDMPRIAASAVPGERPRRRRRADQPDRHHRREHDAAPHRRRCRVSDGVVAAYVHNADGARPRQDRRAGGAGIDRRQGEAGGPRQADRDAHRRRQPAGADGGRRSTRPRSSASARCWPRRPGHPASRAEIVDKMVEGRLRKFYEESCCWSRLFVIDGKTRSKRSSRTPPRRSARRSGTGFVRFALGEGIEQGSRGFRCRGGCRSSRRSTAES